MKLQKRPRRNNGSAVIVIIALLAVMAMLVTANAVALRVLKSELILIEQEQMKKYRQPQKTAEAAHGQDSHD